MPDQLLPHAGEQALEPVRRRLCALAKAPPQTLLLTGGSEAARHEMALFWAMAVNCRNESPPCLGCDVCRQIASSEFLDLRQYDGRIANREDEEKPGPVHALNMRRIRELKGSLGEAPHGPGKRVAVFAGLPLNQRDNAANALLKVLEEPSPYTLFVLLAAERQQVLPTLASRSFCITLPWPDPLEPSASPLEKELAEFLQTGRGFMSQISGKGALDACRCREIILACQRSLLRSLSGTPASELDRAMGRLEDGRKIAQCSRWLGESLEMLNYNVSPTRIMEGLCTNLFCLLEKK